MGKNDGKKRRRDEEKDDDHGHGCQNNNSERMRPSKTSRRRDIRSEEEEEEDIEKSKVKLMRNDDDDAYQSSAYAKAKEEESAKALKQQEQFLTTSQVDRDDDENPIIFGDDDDDLYYRSSLERAKKIAALNKQDKQVVVASGPQLVSSLALAASSKSAAIQIASSTKDQVQPKVKHTNNEDDEHVDNNEMKKEVVLDETIHEVRVGKGLSGALQLLKDRGMLKKTVDWGGRNMDKKKSKLVGIYDENNGLKEIRIERKDEFGRTMTQKEAYRRLSHIFHGKGPGKMKQEKRLKQHQEELKLMQMNNSDTPSQLMERMRETQARLKLPCIVLSSGHVKQG